MLMKLTAFQEIVRNYFRLTLQSQRKTEGMTVKKKKKEFKTI